MPNRFESNSRNCTKCEESKDSTEFRIVKRHVIKNFNDGYAYWCKYCEKKYQAEHFKKNQDWIKVRHKNYILLNREKARLYVRKWVSKNPEYKNRANELRRNNYSDFREKVLEKNRNFYKANKRLFFSKNAKRKAQKLRACPKWVNRKEIDSFYINCPPGNHVDHIVPLQGKNVSGLHVLWNLQYLPAIENLKKGIKF